MKRLLLFIAFHVLVTEAKPKHDLDWALRARLIHVDEAADSGKAGSLLLRGALTSDWSHNISSLVELDGVTGFWGNDHSDGEILNGQPLIPDVPGIDLNQALLSYSGRAWRLRLGRQRISLDDQRFIGGNGFWQNEQTFDALRIERRWFSASRLTYAYIEKANRIYGRQARGESHPIRFLGEHDHQTHMLHLELYEWDTRRLQLFAYFIDNLSSPAASNQTFGGKLQQSLVLDALKYEFTLGVAAQNRPQLLESPNLWYGLLEANAIRGRWRGVARFEVLSEEDDITFTTPLASGHDFHGWADVFSEPLSHGLHNTSVQLQWRAAPWEIKWIYHNFWHDDTGSRLGDELDIEAGYKPARRRELTLRYADFRSRTASYADARKVFLTYSWNL